MKPQHPVKKASKTAPLELTGRTFGSWTVLEKAPDDPARWERGDLNSYWVCQCTCGTVKEVRGTSLMTGGSSQCKPCGTRKVLQRTRDKKKAQTGGEE